MARGFAHDLNRLRKLRGGWLGWDGRTLVAEVVHLRDGSPVCRAVDGGRIETVLPPVGEAVARIVIGEASRRLPVRGPSLGLLVAWGGHLDDVRYDCRRYVGRLVAQREIPLVIRGVEVALLSQLDRDVLRAIRGAPGQDARGVRDACKGLGADLGLCGDRLPEFRKRLRQLVALGVVVEARNPGDGARVVRYFPRGSSDRLPSHLAANGGSER